MTSNSTAAITTITFNSYIQETRCPPRQSEAYLIALQGKNVGKRTLLDRDEILIGRAGDVTIPLDEASVSRHHAIIRKYDQKFIIEDQNSKNGTYVNGKKCGETMLKDQDVIGIGRTIFKFIAGDSLEHPYHDKLHRLALLDPMLGILNKRSFMEYLDQTHKCACSDGKAFALVLFDIDHFKRVNDTYGHAIGDQVLNEVALTVKANLRMEDLFGRMGGEEFAVLLPQANAAQAKLVAEKLRRAIETLCIAHHGNRIAITASLGIAWFDPGNSTGSCQLLEMADGALYRAKQAGRNRVIAYDHG